MTTQTTAAKTRAAYAEHCPYGLRSISGGDRVIRFATAAERDAWVDRANAGSDVVEGVAAAITLAEARKTYRMTGERVSYRRDAAERTA